MQDRPAAGGDGVDAHHRRAHAHARDLGVEGALELAGEWATSVEVPPMSKPMTRVEPASCAVRTMPTTPPAGPDRIASLPWNARPRSGRPRTS
jgi:hypothetical protein